MYDFDVTSMTKSINMLFRALIRGITRSQLNEIVLSMLVEGVGGHHFWETCIFNKGREYKCGTKTVERKLKSAVFDSRVAQTVVVVCEQI